MIYFMQDGSTSIKIGFATNSAFARLAALRPGNPTELVLLLELPGDRGTEGRLHKLFRPIRIAREWYKPASPLLQFIIEAAQAFARGEDMAAWIETALSQGEESMAPRPVGRPDHAFRAARSWLLSRLANGPAPLKTIRKEAEAAGFSSSVLYRACDAVALKVGERGGMSLRLKIVEDAAS